ncbi:MAG: ATP-binding protein [Verrucomicrobia bacterium]|nr:ATP-binding protein [Verrucomicrobiota bacterium]
MAKGTERLFIGRQRELGILREYLTARSASLLVIKGRRRIGKSRLIEEFSKALRTIYFLGLAPEEKITAEDQRRHFANQLEKQIGLGGLEAGDWDDLFGHLSAHTKTGQVLVVFDEINWMGSKDATFLPKLKTAWDAALSKNPQLIMILSGSMAGWIEKNILSSTGFFGRIALDMTLEELPLQQCSLFWGTYAKQISAYEKFKVLSVTGGVPLYLELIRPELSAEENIQRLAFRREGFLYNEFDRIFSDLFSRKKAIYRSIIEQVALQPRAEMEIFKGLGQTPSGTISEYLEELVSTGYLARDYTWNLKTKKATKQSSFRLCDNYLRFYLRYIEPKRELIRKSGSITAPEWYTIMGLQFENLVLNNRPLLYRLLGLDLNEIEYDNPYFQTKTKARHGCQIDLLIQTKFNTLYLCEIKFSKNEIGASVIQEVEEKIKRMVLPRGFSVRPVLIHVNGVTADLEEAGFFSHIIDFGQMFNSNG